MATSYVRFEGVSALAGYRGCRAIREEINDAAAVEVDDDRTVAAALPDRPVVDADPDGSRRIGHRRAGDEPQHGRAACRHVEVREETRPASAPPQARPTLACASPSRRVRRARGARRVMGVSAKVRRRQVGLRQ